ncbi:MAG: ATP-binding protein [Salibacter sp.]|uniref:ATP-binding protein n=1 Tax=Salibacter sp. TaxID=2010995 RepID=UPI0028703AB8|nr:ATP-binding protein [Salibacter sp.]MDR9397856.1 ATP-binding protein [Salibacter sp.]
MNLTKKDIGVILTIVLLLVVMVGGSLFIFDLLIKDRVENEKNYLSRESQICAEQIERSFNQFSYDVEFLFSDSQHNFFGQNQLSTGELQSIKSLMVEHRELIKSITLVRDGTDNRLMWTGKGRFRVQQLDTSFQSIESKSEISFLNGYKNAYLSTDKGQVLFELQTNEFVNNQFKKYFSSLNSYKSLLDANGLIAFDNPGWKRLFNTNNITSTPLQEAFEAEVAASAEVDLKINEEGDAQIFITTFYPVSIYGESMGLVFAMPKSVVVDSIRKNLFFVIAVNLLVIVIVVFVFSRSIQQLRRSAQELRDNRRNLEKLIDQQKLLFEYSRDFTYRHDENHEYDYVSENVQKVLGYTPEEFEKSEYRLFTQNPLNRTAQETTAKLLKGHDDGSLFYAEVRHKNGNPVTLEVKEKPYKDDDGNVVGVIGIAKDVTDKFMSEQKFRILFEYSSDPHLIFNNDGILDCNEAALQMLNISSKDDFIGKLPWEFSKDRQHDGRRSEYKADEMLNVALEKGKHTFDWTYTKTSGQEVPTEVTYTAVTLNNEQVILAVWHDLTERKRVEQALIDAKQRAEELARSKQQFLSSMSHEIRTPLNAVIGYTSFLLEEDPKEDQVDKLKSLKFSADNLLALVNDILDHSKIESGKISFSNEPLQLKDVVSEVSDMMREKVTEKDVDLIQKIDSRVPEKVLGDENRLNQILINIVGNAVKFTEMGKVELKVSQISETRDHHEIEFKITDTGIGIPDDKRETIFNTFEQASSSILNTYGGTGLGLSITKNLVEMQGGSISVESEEGKGSEFTVVLSFEKCLETEKTDKNTPDKNTKSKAPSSGSGRDDLKGYHVLLVEDNPINQKIAAQFLNKWGAKVTLSENGKEALDVITSKEFDLILMDLQMPEMDGYEATKAIRSIDDDYFKNIPVVALTADAFNEVRDSVLEVGMNDYVTKPINPEEFLKVMMRYLKEGVKN